MFATPHPPIDTKEMTATLQKIVHLSNELTDQWNHNNVPTLRSKAHILMNEVSILLWSIESMAGPQAYSPYNYMPQPNIQQNIIHTNPNNRFVQIQNIQQNNNSAPTGNITQTMNMNAKKTTTTTKVAPTSPISSSGSESDYSPQDLGQNNSGSESNTPPCVNSDPFIGNVISRKRRTRSGKTANNKKPKICDICKTTKTPLWRTGPQYSTLCNACGLSYRKMDQLEEAKKESQRKVAIDNLIN